MNPATETLLQRRAAALGNLPAMPSVLQSLGVCLSANPSEVNIERIVELISYDKALAAQCLRMANSALFRGRAEVESIRGAVLALGIWRIRDVVYSSALPNFLVGSDDCMAPPVFWRHALGTALVSQHLAQRLAIPNPDRFYLAGLLHDIGIIANSLLFRDEFARVLHRAETSETPLCEVEQQVLGFTHCESGRILADTWRLPREVASVIEYHHHVRAAGDSVEMSCVIYLADLLCRLRGMGYGYYEARGFDLASEEPWLILQSKYGAAKELDLARFTFELDQRAVEVQELINEIFKDKRIVN